MCKGNLIKIELTNVNREDVTPLPNHLDPEQHQVQTVHPIRYDSAELLAIRERVQHDKRLKILLLSACNIIRRLRLNKWCTRRGISKHKELHQTHKISRGIGCNNLIKIDFHLNHVLHHLTNDKLVVSLANVQSIRRKGSILYGYLHSVKCDISVVTETWLRDDEAEAVWVQCSNLCINEYNFLTSNYKNWPGGGLRLVLCKDFSTKLLEEGAKTSFQYAKWSISCKNRVLKIIAIYHPPYFTRNLVTDNIFIDELTDWLIDTLALDKNVLVMGDFNIHINKDNNEIANIFLNSIVVMGLQCSYSFPTHKEGNCLDLIFAESIGDIMVTACRPIAYISSHQIMAGNTSIPKDDVTRKEITYRKLKLINYTGLTEEMHLDLLLLENLEYNDLKSLRP